MQKKNKNLKNKVIITVGIVTIIVLISIIVIQNVIINNGVEENNYLASGNSNSELLAEYIKKGITIGGITGTLESLDTSDATATAEDILKGETAYVDGNKITGILELLNTSDATATAADIVSGKTAYVNGGKVTGTLSSYKYATGSCETNYVRSYGGKWCTVTGLTFKPFMVIITGNSDDEGEGFACVIDKSITGCYYGGGYSSEQYNNGQALNATFSNGGFTITNASSTYITELKGAKFYAVGN